MTQMNLHTEQKQTHRQNRLAVTKEESGWGRDKLGVWDWQMQGTVYKID